MSEKYFTIEPAKGKALDLLGISVTGLKRKRWLFFFKESDASYRKRLLEYITKAFNRYE